MATSIFDIKDKKPEDVDVQEVLGEVKQQWDDLKSYIMENCTFLKEGRWYFS